MMLVKSWERGISKLARLIDLEKALDRIKREGLWNTMLEERYHIPKTLYWKVKCRGWESEWLDIKTAYGRVMCYPQYYLLYLWTCVLGMPGMVMLERKR